MSRDLIWLNGNIVSNTETVSVFDRGLLYGDGLYETIRVRNGNAIRFDLHLERLTAGLQVLNIPVPRFDLHAAVTDILKAGGLADARVRITVTRGLSVGKSEPTVIATAVPLPSNGLEPTRMVISSYRRDEASPLTRVKTLNCLASVMASMEASIKNADDALLLNTRGLVAEATSANIFLVQGSRLLTPSLAQGCLPGIVRRAVLELAPRMDVQPVECEVGLADLLQADELFLTSAIKLARPVVEMDGAACGTGRHEVCARVREILLREESE